MSAENVEIVRRLYEAVALGETGTVLSLYDPEVDFDYSHGPGADVMGRSVYHGHEGLRRFFGDWREVFEQVEFGCDELIDAGDHVISVDAARGRGRASGAEVEMKQYGVWTVRGGKIARVRWFATREYALQAAGGQ
jgi:ketosteroid isomerase-like protein